MLQVDQGEVKCPARMSPDRISPAEGQDWDEVSKHHQQNDGHNVVRNGTDCLAQHFDHAQQFVFRIVAGPGAEQVAKNPRNQHRGNQQAERIRHGLANHLGHRGREISERRAEVTPEQATPKREILLDRTARQAVHICQSGAH